uniref:Uncharacterized protein n=1 Tax=Rhizophora mucronata TaxID=61149 RepID=A0A2P2PEY8_RHIMU
MRCKVILITLCIYIVMQPIYLIFSVNFYVFSV